MRWILAIALLTAAVGCENEQACDVANVGEIEFANNYGEPVTLYVENDSFGEVAVGEHKRLALDADTYFVFGMLPGYSTPACSGFVPVRECRVVTLPCGE